MNNIQTNKFEIADVPGTKTLAFLVEQNESEIKNGEVYYSLQKLDGTNKEENGRIVTEFLVRSVNEDKQDIVLLTLTNSKALLSTGVLDNKGLTPTEDNLDLSYGSLYNDNNIEYKEFVYTPNMKRRFAIIDTISCEEVKPVVRIDEITKQVKGVCKLLPLRPYVVLEVKANYNRGAVVATDGKRIEAISHGAIKLADKTQILENNEFEIEIDTLNGDEMIV